MAELSDITSFDEPYREMFEHSPAALYRTAPDGRLVYVNAALIDLLGYPNKASFMRLNAADVYADPEDRLRWRAHIESGDSVPFEMRDCRRDGSIIWIRDTARAVRDKDGQVIWYDGTLADITAQRASDAAEENEGIPGLGRSFDAVRWEWRPTSRGVSWGEGLRTTFGYSPADVGRSIERSYRWWLRRIHPEDRARVAGELHRAVESGGTSWSSRYRFRSADGSYAEVLERGRVDRNPDGAPTRLCGTIMELCELPEGSGAENCPCDSPPVRTSDATLMEWISQGDEQALVELHGRHADTLLHAATGASASPQDAEEIVTDVLLRAWKHAGRYDPARGSVIAWLKTMVRSRALAGTRKRRRRRSLLAAEVTGEGGPLMTPPSGGASASEAQRVCDRVVVEDTLAQLPEPQRHAVALAYLQGRTHAEIAARLGEPLGTVKTRIRDGIRRMRGAMSPGSVG